MVSPFGSYLPDSHSETRDNGTERASASLALSPLEDVIARTFLSSSRIFMAGTLRFSDSAVNTCFENVLLACHSLGIISGSANAVW